MLIHKDDIVYDSVIDSYFIKIKFHSLRSILTNQKNRFTH